MAKHRISAYFSDTKIKPLPPPEPQIERFTVFKTVIYLDPIQLKYPTPNVQIACDVVVDDGDKSTIRLKDLSGYWEKGYVWETNVNGKWKIESGQIVFVPEQYYAQHPVPVSVAFRYKKNGLTCESRLVLVP